MGKLLFTTQPLSTDHSKVLKTFKPINLVNLVESQTILKGIKIPILTPKKSYITIVKSQTILKGVGTPILIQIKPYKGMGSGDEFTFYLQKHLNTDTTSFYIPEKWVNEF